jgi:hypothetical protein
MESRMAFSCVPVNEEFDRREKVFEEVFCMDQIGSGDWI